MRRTFVLSLALLTAPLFAGCLGDIGDNGLYSPDDPQSFDSSMFNANELAKFQDLDQRAYVMGHAIGVYLMGKKLPSFVAYKGYLYRPGHSSPSAQVPYEWEKVMIARSGGSDGRGHLIYDDVPQPGQNGNCNDDPTNTDDVPQPDGTCGGSGGDGGDGGSGPIDPDCEEFLDPAAVLAREDLPKVDANAMLGHEFDGPDRDRYVSDFQLGMAHATRVQDFNEDVKFSEVEHVKPSVQGYGLCEHSPIVLDLDNNGVALSTAAAGVRFDLLGTGAAVKTGWLTGGDAFLAMDRNGNGTIDGGAELFGEQVGVWHDGFAALAELDRPELGGNADGVIDAKDAWFGRLVVWTDANRDGASTPDELRSLASVGVTSLSLGYEKSDALDAAGNALRLRGSFTRELADGTCTASEMTDVWVSVRR
jgi:hypothetical protein